MHALLAIDPFLLVAVILGAVAFPGWFRVYTVTSIVVASALAVISIQYVPAAIANEPTPWMGVVRGARRRAVAPAIGSQCFSLSSG